MKKLINRPDAVVSEYLEGIEALGYGLRRLPGEWTMVRSDAAPGHRVAVISGGGAGHEPAHVGFVGDGLLIAAVSGDVFTSPSVDAILTAIRAVTGPGGALLIVKNYTGDRLNFGLAAELAREDGLDVRMVVVADDVAHAARLEAADRRGIAGTVFVHKIAGAAAASGASLDDVAREAQAAALAVRTMGVGLGPCVPPAAGHPSFSLGGDEMELGLGIHGEPGIQRIAVRDADGIVDLLLDAVIRDLQLTPGDRVALLVNGLGGTPHLELGVVARASLQWLQKRGFDVQRTLCSSLLTSLEMPGCSLSLLRLDDQRLMRLDAQAHAPAWPAALGRPQTLQVATTRDLSRASDLADHLRLRASEPAVQGLRETLVAVAEVLLSHRDQLTEMDRLVGDGDLGISLSRGAQALLSELDVYPLSSISETLRTLAATARRTLGGSSGPLYAIALLRAAAALDQHEGSRARWAYAMQAACDGISDLGGARSGDRTMLDAMLPAAEALASGASRGEHSLTMAVEAAAKGAAATATMMPRRGRSNYLAERALGHMDPGAYAVRVWLSAVHDATKPYLQE